MKKLKKKIAVLLATMLVCCLGALLSISVSTSSAEVAQAQDNFYMLNGAAIRLKQGEFGIRYSTVVTESFYDSLLATYGGDATVEFYTVIGKGEEFADEQEYLADETPTFDGVTHQYVYHEAVYFDSADADTELNAKAYVKVTPNGQEPVTIDAVSEDMMRSMRGVALDLLVSGEYETADKAVIEAYVGGEITVRSDTATEVIGHYDSTDKYGKIELPLSAGTYTAYYGAKKLGSAQISAESKEMELCSISGLTVGDDYKVSLYNEDTKTVYQKSFKCVTKILTEAADLEIFKVREVDGKYEGLFDGYYVLGNDITATGYTHAVGMTGIDGESSRWFMTTAKYKNCGLTGTFDGNGHRITNLTISRHGLFGTINGGTVKNVGFNALTLSGSNCTSLCWFGFNATIENVYLYIPGVYNTWASTLLGSCFWQSSISNVLIRNEALTGDPSNTGNHGSFVSTNINNTPDGTQPNNLSNVFIISPVAATYMASITIDGENRDCENKYQGVRRWDSRDDLKNNVNYLGADALPAIDYSSFTESGFWYVDGGGYLVFGKQA